jgi:hypothetical protein
MSRRPATISLGALLVAGCSGGLGPTTAPTQLSAASLIPSPTPAAQRTSPPATLIPGCLPACWTGRLVRPNGMSGTYTTRNFFGGQLTVTVPDGWWGYEDSTSELSIGLPNDSDARVEIWIDIYAVSDPTGMRDKSIERTGDALIPWFLAKPLIKLIKREPATLGGLPAEAIEYRRNDRAANEDPGCPVELRPCAVDFGYPEWDGAFSEGGPFHSRLLWANATWGGAHHTVYLMFWAMDPNYGEMIGDVQAIIDSIQLPEGVGPG